jgi:hypothetical protein
MIPYRIAHNRQNAETFRARLSREIPNPSFEGMISGYQCLATFCNRNIARFLSRRRVTWHFETRQIYLTLEYLVSLNLNGRIAWFLPRSSGHVLENTIQKEMRGKSVCTPIYDIFGADVRASEFWFVS